MRVVPLTEKDGHSTVTPYGPERWFRCLRCMACVSSLPQVDVSCRCRNIGYDWCGWRYLLDESLVEAIVLDDGEELPVGVRWGQLEWPSTPESAPKFAARAVEEIADSCGSSLDYSPISLSDLDDAIERLRSDGPPVAQVAEVLFGFGCYVGEVLLRNGTGRWRRAEDGDLEAGSGVGLVIELDGRFCDPIGRVFKRYKNGTIDSLLQFYKRLTEPPSPK